MADRIQFHGARNAGYEISTDPSRLDIDMVERFLGASYWASQRSRSKIERSIETSIVFGVYENVRQIGFARVVTDRVDFAWLCDVWMDPQFRGNGIGKWLMETVLAHPDLQDLRRWILATRDAHGLYEQFGFVPLGDPKGWMERTSTKTFVRDF
jgi:GNAT superfamily N-acetyltransferase